MAGLFTPELAVLVAENLSWSTRRARAWLAKLRLHAWVAGSKIFWPGDNFFFQLCPVQPPPPPPPTHRLSLAPSQSRVTLLAWYSKIKK